MFAIATLVRYQNGTHAFRNGSIIHLPAELCDLPRMRQYSKIVKSGWGVGEFGYHYFAKSGPNGELFIFPGLMIRGSSKVTKRIYGYDFVFTKDQIELFASDICQFEESARSVAQEDFNLLIHDLRAISNAIYNSAEEARRFAANGDMHETRVRLGNVIASQTILSIRTDALDFVGNPAAMPADAEVPIYQRVDKVCRSFKPRAWDQRKVINLMGRSTARVFGPEILEIVPYTLIDNAIKYAPRDSEIDVEVSDGVSVHLRVRSLGPKIEPEEYASIFNRGVRGRAAIASGVPGSGLGLHLVHKIVTENFHGTISVTQAESKWGVDGVDLHETEFHVELPLHRV
jgi:signal transduction histidine kinase